MAIIPRYTSRALPPGAQPGLIESAQKRGEAGAGLARSLGGAIVAGVAYKKRKDLLDSMRKDDSEAASGDKPRPPIRPPYRASEGKPQPPVRPPHRASGKAAEATNSLSDKVNAQKAHGVNIDLQSDKVFLGSFETTIVGLGAEAKAALNKAGYPAKGAAQRALAGFDQQVLKLANGIEDRPHLKGEFGALVASVRAPLELRLLGQENARRVVEDKAQLTEALDGLALAAVEDPAMAAGVTGRGLAQIEGAMEAGMLAPEEAAEMQRDFADRVHMSAMRGQIAADPAVALAKLESGEFDDIFETPARDQLVGEARTTARVKAAGASAAARARRRGLELDMAEHLETLAETGMADEAVAARARAELPDFQYAAFQAGQARARERYATRAEYAFMTQAEIEADITAKAPGGILSDTDERAAAHALRTEIRDEVLSARAADPAGWAMRDEDVAAAFAAAQENPDDPMLARKAIQQRLALQREMGIEQPRLLSDAERDDIAGDLAQATPADRPAIIADLRGRYGEHYESLVTELSGRVAPDVRVLMAHAGDPLLAAVLARGMAMDSVEFTGARVLTLPMIDGRLDSSRLVDKQLYSFMAGDRVVKVVYDRKADALVPALVAEGGEGDGSGQMGRIRSGIHGAGQEVANIVAGVPKSQAFFAAEIARATLEDMLAIQMGGEPYWVHRDHADKATIYRFRQATPEERLRMLAEQASTFPQDHPFYRFGEAISEFARENLPTNPEFEDELFQKLMRAGGNLGGLILVGGVLRRAGVPPVLTVAATGATTQMVAQFEDALRSGATMEEAYEAADFGALVGLTEALPITRLFDRLDKGTGGSIRRALIEAAKGGAEEALQETFQTVMTSLIASDLVGYDPDRRIFEGLGENAGISFTLGGVVNFVAAIAGGRRSVSNGQAREDIAQEDATGVDPVLEDLGNAPLGEAVGEGAQSDVEAVAGPDPVVSVAGTPRDETRRDQYYESSLHEKFRGEAAEKAEAGQAGHNAFGLIDPASGKPIIQPINDTDRMLAMAEENVQPLAQQLKEIAADLPGVEFSGARAKGPDRVAEKLAKGRRPDTVGDYLGGRIVVDDPQMLDEAVRALTGRYKIVEADDFVDNPRGIGYRAIHVQVVLDNGMTAEIQIMPREILPVFEKDHENYERWRDKSDLTPEDARKRDADKARAQKAYAEAYQRWLQRAKDESTLPNVQ